VASSLESIGGYAFWGVLGALVALFSTWNSGKRPTDGKPWWTFPVYVVVGGIVAVVFNIASNPTFSLAQIPLAFVAGLSWPAIVESRRIQKDELAGKGESLVVLQHQMSQVQKAHRESLLASNPGRKGHA
jgi:hypothetical protein